MDEEFEKRQMQMIDSLNQDWCDNVNNIQDYFEKLSKDGGAVDMSAIMGLIARIGTNMMGNYSKTMTSLSQINREAKMRIEKPKRKGFF